LKLSDIIKQVNRDIDDSYANADIIDWVNRCLDELTPIAKKEKKTAFTITSDNSYTVPSDWHDTALVVVDKTRYALLAQEDYDNKGYRQWESNISLQNGPDSGTVELFYYKRLTKLVNPDEVPEIEEEFHDLLILYASAHSQYADEEPERQQDAMMRYLSRKRDYETYRKTTRRLKRVRVVDTYA
jgi:hypothetical protein